MNHAALIQQVGILSTVVCLTGAFLCLLLSRGSRARRLLAFTLFMWAMAYLSRMIWRNMPEMMQYGVMALPTLLVGHFYVIVTMLYPIEVSRPGWLSLRSCVLLFLPFLTITTAYFIGTHLCGRPIRLLRSPEDIFNYFNEFNVWFRFVLYLSILSYIAYTLTIIYLDEPRNGRWLREHFSTPERVDTRWLHWFGFGFALITLSFLLVLLNNEPWNSVVHTLLVQVFFILTVWKALTQKNPYPEGYFSGNSPRSEEHPGYYTLEGIAHSQLFHHKVTVDNWLHSEKPYLDPRFEIADIANIVPLGPDQLARLFNLSYGEPFATVVRKLRVGHSLQLLADPALSLEDVARRSGFVDEAAFRQAFVCYEGHTPEEYRVSYREENR